ncbi:MAG TPA: hypothetical protein VGK91_07260, partial [Candidatus Udaeobacter sp.]
MPSLCFSENLRAFKLCVFHFFVDKLQAALAEEMALTNSSYEKTPQNLTTTLTLTPIILACFAFSQMTHAEPDVNPAPDGDYPGFTTAEGKNALKNLTSGVGNSGFGWYSLFSVTTASYNTGLGAGTLALNTAQANTASGVAALILNTSGTRNSANGAGAMVW